MEMDYNQLAEALRDAVETKNALAAETAERIRQQARAATLEKRLEEEGLAMREKLSRMRNEIDAARSKLRYIEIENAGYESLLTLVMRQAALEDAPLVRVLAVAVGEESDEGYQTHLWLVRYGEKEYAVLDALLYPIYVTGVINDIDDEGALCRNVTVYKADNALKALALWLVDNADLDALYDSLRLQYRAGLRVVDLE